MREVFISYKSYNQELGNNDETVANELCQALESAGITCWMAPRDIPSGSDFDDCIAEAIEACNVFLIVFSQYTIKSSFIFDELRIAYDHRKHIIRFKLDDTKLRRKWNLRLGSRQWFDASDNYRKGIFELVSALCRKLGKPEPDQIGSSEEKNEIKKFSNRESVLRKDNKTDDKATYGDKDVISIKMFTVKDVSFKMVCVDGGTFMMGATPEQGNDVWISEKPSHKVTLSSFCIGETLVTQELWQVVMGNNPSLFKGNLQRPVENIFWKDCHEFIKKLNGITGKKFRLPTEAEWEFAARGGNRSKGYKYAGSNNLDEVAWYADNTIISKKRVWYGAIKCTRSIFPVATKKANELGIYDMSGNVWEWCQDWYGEYSGDAQMRPIGPSSGPCRVFRGGGWVSAADKCRVSYRNNRNWDPHWLNCGLRLALDL